MVLNNVVSVTRNKPNNFNVSNVKSIYVEDGVYSTTNYNSLLESYISELEKKGFKLYNVNSLILTDVTLKDYKTDYGKSTKITNPLFAAVYSESPATISMKNNAIIENSFRGILSEKPLNIYMNGSKIQTCNRGINLSIKESNNSLLKMTCSTLLNNQIGVYGNDIILAIDGVINQQSEGSPFVLTNQFTSVGSNLIFYINYFNSSLDQIHAKHNIWSNNTAYSFTNSSNLPISVFKVPYGTTLCGSQLQGDCDDAASLFPIVSNEIHSRYYTDFGGVIEMCNGDTLLNNYWKGYNCIKNEEFESANNFFKPIANDFYLGTDYSSFPYLNAIVLEAKSWVNSYEKYNNLAPELNFNFDSCRLEWDSIIPGDYKIQKYIDNEWEAIYSGESPYNILSNNYGTFRLFIETSECEVYFTDSVNVDCDSLQIACAQIIDFDYVSYQNDSMSITTELNEPISFEIVFIVFDSHDDSILNICTIPVLGQTGINIDTISLNNDLLCNPDSVIFDGHYLIFLNCPLCDTTCISDTLYAFVAKTSKVGDIDNAKILIYPNPTNDFLNIKSSQISNTITLHRADGVLVHRRKLDSELTQINMDNFNSGVYIVKIMNEIGETIQTSKVIKME